ncbi:MAG TPA: GntR family transcriptional regulator [Plantibacter sp.]|uniref:GntR family transcriptional regulator n=1 Tax=unclassified Plantibacter TaxID=2624265 RepID=UPI002B6E805C|nr:GntR family transcriptional regulator [Plantibacter sp.]
MPVPHTVETCPRKLLRDVVFEQLLTAIEDGTLEPGERLNDDELEKWLGVSRTPIREAISRLADIGLVETAPQRYTRVAKPTPEQYAEALQLLNGFHELSTRWSIPHFTDADVAGFRELGDAVLADIEARDKGVLLSSAAFADFLVERSGNSLLQQMARQMNTRVVYSALPTIEYFQWDMFAAYVDGLVAAAEKRSAEDAERVVRKQALATDAFLEQVIAAGGSVPAE